MFKLSLNENAIIAHKIINEVFRKANKDDFYFDANSFARMKSIKSNASFKVFEKHNFIKVRYSCLCLKDINFDFNSFVRVLTNCDFISDFKVLRNIDDFSYSFSFKVRIN